MGLILAVATGRANDLACRVSPAGHSPTQGGRVIPTLDLTGWLGLVGGGLGELQGIQGRPLIAWKEQRCRSGRRSSAGSCTPTTRI